MKGCDRLMADRDILDQIDDVITWHGSADAMVWTAEPPKLLSTEDLAPDPELTRQFAENLGRQVQAFVDAFRPAAEQMMRNVGAVVQAFSRLGTMPEIREFTEDQRRRRRAMKAEYARRTRGRRSRIRRSS